MSTSLQRGIILENKLTEINHASYQYNIRRSHISTDNVLFWCFNTWLYHNNHYYLKYKPAVTTCKVMLSCDVESSPHAHSVNVIT